MIDALKSVDKSKNRSIDDGTVLSERILSIIPLSYS